MNDDVIVGGADINNYSYIRNCLREDDYIIFCDSGLKHMDALQVIPGLIVEILTPTIIHILILRPLYFPARRMIRIPFLQSRKL